MIRMISIDELPYGGTAHSFEGYRYGDAGVFVIQEGNVTFTVENEFIEATGGQILVEPAGAWLPTGSKDRERASPSVRGDEAGPGTALRHGRRG